jgi:alpha-D-xyloside xylohydrolase
MLKKAFEEYKNTGKPPIRALVMDYTDDKETYNIDDQYMFFDNLIVAPMTAVEDKRRVYLPKASGEIIGRKRNYKVFGLRLKRKI